MLLLTVRLLINDSWELAACSSTSIRCKKQWTTRYRARPRSSTSDARLPRPPDVPLVYTSGLEDASS
jgi:hypothetical protein